jgi:4-amino-4-deoxy-L-arabinose transferase-like glycosyltransferase
MQKLLARLAARPAWAIALLGLALYLSGSWILPLVDRDEPRFAEATREMRERNDWVVPWFNGQHRFDKPPLIYWVQWLDYRLLGENAFAARLPSALFATGASLLVFFWARRLAKPQTALSAAVVFMTCLQMLVHARLAVADMPMVFFVTAAVWSGWELSRPQAARAHVWWLVFHLSLAFGFLAKGPVAWLPIGGLLLGCWLRPQAFNLSWGRFAAGMLLTLSLVAAWGIPAILRTNGEFMAVGIGQHVVYRSIGVMEGHGAGGWLGWVLTLPFYMLAFFFSFFPWAIRVPRALRCWWPSRRRDAAGWYLLTQAGLVFLAFTLVRTKLPHYTLPAFPALAIWLAREVERGTIAGLKISRWAPVMAGVTLAITIAGFLALRPLFVAHELFQKSKPYLKPEMRFATVQYTEPSLVWEFRGMLTNHMQVLNPDQVESFINRGGPVVLVVPTSFCKTNPGSLARKIIEVHARGINVVKGRKVELTALIAL